MNKRFSRAAAVAGGVLLALAAGGAAAAVTVNFVQPDHYADVPFSPVERDQVLKDLRAHLEKLGAALPAGTDLSIDVLDVDLAGTSRPSAHHPDLRVLKGGADWPQMHLRYTLSRDGKVIKSGNEQLADMSYLDHVNRYSSDTRLRYEKQMLDDWFKHTVAPGVAAG